MGLFKQTEEEKLAREKIKEEKRAKAIEKYHERIDEKREKYQEKYHLKDLDNSDVEIIKKVKEHLSHASSHNVGIPSERYLMIQQASLLKALVEQNWILMNHLKEIEKRLENLENKN